MVKSHVSRKKNHFSAELFQSGLLDWYDQNRRILPWRAQKGECPDPYRVWLSEIMLQQTTVPAVIPYFNKFIAAWPRAEHLALANPDDVMKAWAGLGYYARARNLLKCARTVVDHHGGAFPSDLEDLMALPGVGPYTAAAISAIAFGVPAIVVDGNVERITARVFCIKTPLPEGKSKIRDAASSLYEGLAEGEVASDFPQALMDLGSMICTPKSPKCGVCPVRVCCAAATTGADAEKLPARAPKKEKPLREGTALWLENGQGDVVLERRAEDRMLGAMIGLPSTAWDSPQKDQARIEIGETIIRVVPNLSDLSSNFEYCGVVTHSFSHFNLKLHVFRGEMAVPRQSLCVPHFLIPSKDVIVSDFPSVFRKAVRLVIRSGKQE